MKKSIAKAAFAVAFLPILAFAGQKSGEVSLDTPASEMFLVIEKSQGGMRADEQLAAKKIVQLVGSKVFRSGRVHDFGMQSNVNGVTGIQYDEEAGSVEFFWKWSQGLNSNVIKAAFHFQVQTADDPSKIQVKVTCPSSLKQEVRDLSLFGIPQWDIKMISSDVAFACSPL